MKRGYKNNLAVLYLFGAVGAFSSVSCRLSIEREIAQRRIEILALEAYHVRLSKGFGRGEIVLLNTLDRDVVTEWRGLLRVVPQLDVPPISYEEVDGEQVIVEEIANCNCAYDYKLTFLQGERVVLHVELVHVWDHHACVRCKDVNLGSDTPLTAEAAEALRQRLRALGEEAPTWESYEPGKIANGVES